MKVDATKRALFLLVMLLASPVHADEWDSLPDPTRPEGAAPVGDRAGGLVLQTTMVSSGRRVAVINGRTLGVGERIGGAVIREIKPYEVVLDQGGRQMRLRMLPRLDKDNMVKDRTHGRS